MNKKIKISLITFGTLFIIFTLGHIPVWIDDSKARDNKAIIKEMISVGSDLNKAEIIIKKAGFKLMYDSPITPTYDKSYLSQLVIVGNTQPNIFETIGYAAQLPWMPFTSNESPYLIIDATLDGKITEIE